MLKFLTYFQTKGDAEHSHFHIKSMKNTRRFTQINRVLRFGSGVALISAAAAMALVAIKPSNPSLTTSQEPQWTEDGKMSAAFAKHREDLYAATVHPMGSRGRRRRLEDGQGPRRWQLGQCFGRVFRVRRDRCPDL